MPYYVRHYYGRFWGLQVQAGVSSQVASQHDNCQATPAITNISNDGHLYFVSSPRVHVLQAVASGMTTDLLNPGSKSLGRQTC